MTPGVRDNGEDEERVVVGFKRRRPTLLGLRLAQRSRPDLVPILIDGDSVDVEVPAPEGVARPNQEKGAIGPSDESLGPFNAASAVGPRPFERAGMVEFQQVQIALTRSEGIGLPKDEEAALHGLHADGDVESASTVRRLPDRLTIQVGLHDQHIADGHAVLGVARCADGKDGAIICLDHVKERPVLWSLEVADPRRGGLRIVSRNGAPESSTKEQNGTGPSCHLHRVSPLRSGNRNPVQGIVPQGLQLALDSSIRFLIR